MLAFASNGAAISLLYFNLQRIQPFAGCNIAIHLIFSTLNSAGDLMGRAMKNLDKLLAMPYGCGEQNMVLFAPNIFILNYLKSTGQLTKEIQDRATRFLESGEECCLICDCQKEKSLNEPSSSRSVRNCEDASSGIILVYPCLLVALLQKIIPYCMMKADTPV